MKITIQDLPEGEEDEIIIRCRTVDERLLKLIYGIRAGQEKLTVTRDDKLFQIQPAHHVLRRLYFYYNRTSSESQ